MGEMGRDAGRSTFNAVWINGVEMVMNGEGIVSKEDREESDNSVPIGDIGAESVMSSSGNVRVFADGYTTDKPPRG
jgi:hypothetical protein